MKEKKRKSLKKSLLTKMMIFVAIMIVIITQITVYLAVGNIQSLTNKILARESISYSKEIASWWDAIESRVYQDALVIKNSPAMSDDDTWQLLLKLTPEDPDSHDVYIANGNTGAFLDGSGWVPDETFDFSQKSE